MSVKFDEEAYNGLFCIHKVKTLCTHAQTDRQNHNSLTISPPKLIANDKKSWIEICAVVAEENHKCVSQSEARNATCVGKWAKESRLGRGCGILACLQVSMKSMQ